MKIVAHTPREAPPSALVVLTPAQTTPLSVLAALDALIPDHHVVESAADIADVIDAQDTVRRLVTRHGAAAVARWVRIFAAEEM
jgi:hypothetical protein